ncbi:MAG: hypothetical protein R3321_02720 [Nitrososphaeraceae archaeon]|nr:hypothetical protein [Nitrososphaeraceae archaeon]
MTEVLFQTTTATPASPANGSDSADVDLITRVVPYTGYSKIRVNATVKVVETGGSTAQNAPLLITIGAAEFSFVNVTAAAADTNFITLQAERAAAQGATVKVGVDTLAGADAATTYQVVSFTVEGV